MVKQRIQANLRAAVVAALALVVLVSPQVAYAQTTKTNPSTNVLKVSPVRSDIQIKPGESKTVTTTITNLTDQAITVQAVENDFIAGDDRGTPALILEADKYAPTHSLKRFMKPLGNVTVPAKDSVNVDVVITVPKDAKAGGYYGAVRFAPLAGAEGGQVNMSASAASLILLTVPGEMTEKLQLTDFSIQQDDKNGTLFQTPNNLQLSFAFQNTGSLHAGPMGKISVKQNDKIVYETDFNNQLPREMILPDSSRRWDVPLKSIGNFGYYTVTATYTYGVKNQSVTETKSFWVIPLAVMIGAVVGLLLLIALIVGIIWFLRSYKKRILQTQGRGGSGNRR